MMLPVTEYQFEVDTKHGKAIIEIVPTKYSIPAACSIDIRKSEPMALLAVMLYFRQHGFGMHGTPFEIMQAASPMNVAHALGLNDSYLKDRGMNDPDILGYRIIEGHIPPDDWTYDEDDPDNWEDDEDEDLVDDEFETDPITESAVQPNQSPTVSQDQSGKAMKFTLDTQRNTMEGIHRPDIGWIAFLWGIPGTGPLFSDGDGLARIIAKQDWEKKYLPSEPSGRDLCMRLVDIVTRGYVKRRYGTTSYPLIDYSWQGEIAVVRWDPARKTWYLYGYRKDWGSRMA